MTYTHGKTQDEGHLNRLEHHIDHSTDDQPDYHVAIIGAGFAGLGMAIRLKERGMEDFVVLERAGEVGGT